MASSFLTPQEFHLKKKQERSLMPLFPRNARYSGYELLLWRFKMVQFWNGHTDNLFSPFLALGTCTGRRWTHRTANDSIRKGLLRRRDYKTINRATLAIESHLKYILMVSITCAQFLIFLVFNNVNNTVYKWNILSYVIYIWWQGNVHNSNEMDNWWNIERFFETCRAISQDVKAAILVFQNKKRGCLCLKPGAHNQTSVVGLKIFLMKTLSFFPWILNLYQAFSQMSNKARNWYFLDIPLIFFPTSSLLSNAHARSTKL